MANLEKVTVDKGYFDAILRRADFHTSTQILGRHDAGTNITISKVEYDSLLRTSRELHVLKSALFQGGITEETLDLLTSGANGNDQRKDSAFSTKEPNSWYDDVVSNLASNQQSIPPHRISPAFNEMSWRTGAAPATFNLAPGSGPFNSTNLQPSQARLRVPSLQRQVSYGMSSMPDDIAFDDDESFAEGSHNPNTNVGAVSNNNERRTLFLSGFSERTTYRDLLSVVKGGKLLSINLRPERTATLTFLEGAAEFLAWAKRNDIYLNSKRLEIKWADRQFNLNAHIGNKIANGATRNIVIRGAAEKGLTESQVRIDMDHIHNLIIIDIQFKGDGDAYVSMNSVHNALFARTCMMSRSTYKGCKIEFCRDECDVPLTASRPHGLRNITPIEPPKKKKAMLSNRFDMLNIDGADGSSDEENHTPSDDNGSDDESGEMTPNVGVSLNFLDSDST